MAENEKKPETPALDPLRATIWELTADQQDAIRGQLLGMIVEALAQASASHLQDVARFLDIQANDHGADTPAESFLTRMVTEHYLRGGLTPDDAVRAIEGEDGFRAAFSDAIDIARRFLSRHSGLLAAADALDLFERGRALVGADLAE